MKYLNIQEPTAWWLAMLRCENFKFYSQKTFGVILISTTSMLPKTSQEHESRTPPYIFQISKCFSEMLRKSNSEPPNAFLCDFCHKSLGKLATGLLDVNLCGQLADLKLLAFQFLGKDSRNAKNTRSLTHQCSSP